MLCVCVVYGGVCVCVCVCVCVWCVVCVCERERERERESCRRYGKPSYAVQQCAPFTVPIATKLGWIAWICSKSNFTKIIQEIWKLGIKTYWRPWGNYVRPLADFHKTNSCPTAVMTNTYTKFEQNKTILYVPKPGHERTYGRARCSRGALLFLLCRWPKTSLSDWRGYWSHYEDSKLFF